MYFDIHKNPQTRKYWWVAKGGNNETICASQPLTTKQACKRAIRRLMDDAADAIVYDETGERVGDVDARRITV